MIFFSLKVALHCVYNIVFVFPSKLLLVYYRFEHCSLSSLSLKGIIDAGYVRMTMVQEATLPLILEGQLAIL